MRAPYLMFVLIASLGVSACSVGQERDISMRQLDKPGELPLPHHAASEPQPFTSASVLRRLLDARLKALIFPSIYLGVTSCAPSC